MTDPTYVLRGSQSGAIVRGTNLNALTFDASGERVGGQPVAAAGVTSVFGRPGPAVVALAGDYSADEVINDSTVTGLSVADALDTLKAATAAVQSSVGEASFVFNVGKSASFYPTIQAAIDRINVLIGLGVIGSGQRATVRVWPGQYVMTARVDVPGFVSIEAVTDKSTVQLFNATTDMFRATGDNVWFANFIIEGSANEAIYAFDGNNKNGFHVRNVDMLNNNGTSTQKFLKQSGATWRTMFLEHIVIDSFQVSNYAIFLENTSAAGRFVDVEVNDVFCDTYHMTNFGGGFLVRGCQDVRFRNSKIRGGTSNFQTGIRVEKGTPTGTPLVEVFTSLFENSGSGVSIFNEASTTVSVYNSQAPNCIFAGGNVVKNSFVA